MKHLEVKTIEHKGVKVAVKVNYDDGTVSLVEALPNQSVAQYSAKNWIFKNRGLEYMNGWLEILEAMTVAVKEVKKDLENDLAEKSRFRDKEVADGMKLVALANKKRK